MAKAWCPNEQKHHFCSKKCYLRYLKHCESYSYRRKGKDHPKWRGGRVEHGGYVRVVCKGHPKGGRDGYVDEHRLVMEKYLGRYLESWEIVHHLNGIKNDNRINNLVIVSRKTHETHTFERLQAKQIRILESRIKFLEQRLKVGL
jgi:hypothetical protein